MVKPRDALAAECDELHLAVLIIGFKTNSSGLWCDRLSNASTRSIDAARTVAAI